MWCQSCGWSYKTPPASAAVIACPRCGGGSFSTHFPRRNYEAMDLYGGLPDARMALHRRLVQGPTGWMEECYCVNCGHSGGLISKDWAEHVFYLCDSCADKHGRITLPEVPEPVVRGG